MNGHTGIRCLTLFYCALQILCVVQIEGCGNRCVEQVYRCHFFSSICSLVCMSHFVNSCPISNFVKAERGQNIGLLHQLAML